MRGIRRAKKKQKIISKTRPGYTNLAAFDSQNRV